MSLPWAQSEAPGRGAAVGLEVADLPHQSYLG